jgi:imidazolonepropionase-like amidohydrolase
MAKAGNATHKKSIAQGIFYALNPNNIRPQGATPAASAGLVELQAAGGGVTRPGGHPEPLYTGLAQRGWLGSLKVADLPGKAFHTATTIAEAKAAVAAVKANGAVMIKLYLLDHDKPTSNGLSGPVFDAAVAEAKRLGLRPIVHVESAADYRRAIAQGVHAIVHLPYALSNDRKPEEMMLTSQDAAATAKAGTIIVPTATVALASNDGEELRKIRAIQLNNLTLLRDAGVIMAVGADNFTLDMHDEINTLRSFGIFEGSDIIAMATVNGAKLAFPDRKIGQFEAGYEASFIGYFAPLPGNWADQRNPVIGMRAGSVMIDTVDWLSKSCPKQPNG